jgi:hypothetical protein
VDTIQRPISGVGHDYINLLSETVNSAVPCAHVPHRPLRAHRTSVRRATFRYAAASVAVNRSNRETVLIESGRFTA